MIRIDFPEVADNQTSLSVIGHSGSAEKGRDIICSAVSVLVQTFAAGVEKELNAEIKGLRSDGKCQIKIRVKPEVEKEFEAVCKVFKFGFQKLAQAYPEQVLMNSVT